MYESFNKFLLLFYYHKLDRISLIFHKFKFIYLNLQLKNRLNFYKLNVNFYEINLYFSIFILLLVLSSMIVIISPLRVLLQVISAFLIMIVLNKKYTVNSIDKYRL